MNKRISPFAALKFKNFRLLWIGLLISSIGSQMQVVALTWHVYILTHSAFSLAYIGMARFIPLLISAPITGVLADRIERKKLMYIAQSISTVSTFILTWATFSNHISPIVIYILLGISSIGSALDMPARHSLVPSIVPKEFLMNALSLNTIMWQSSIVIGPSIAGFIIAYLGVGTIYFFNALSFLAVIIALFLMDPIKQTVIKTTSSHLSSYKEGLKFVFKTPLIASTMFLDFFATFFSSVTILMPIFAKEILTVGPQGLGFLYAAPSIGAIVAGLIFSSFNQLRHQGKILIGAIILYGFATILFGISKSFPLSLFFLALIGIGDVISAIIRNTSRQLLTPDNMRGRMTSINMIFFTGGPQLGDVEAGIVAGILGAPTSVVVGGLGTIIATIAIILKVPELWRYHGQEIL